MPPRHNSPLPSTRRYRIQAVAWFLSWEIPFTEIALTPVVPNEIRPPGYYTARASLALMVGLSEGALACLAAIIANLTNDDGKALDWVVYTALGVTLLITLYYSARSIKEVGPDGLTYEKKPGKNWLWQLSPWIIIGSLALLIRMIHGGF